MVRLIAIAHNAAMSDFVQLLGLAILLALSVALYFALRGIAPGVARLSLSLGGALVGGVLGVALLLVLTLLIRNSSNPFGLVGLVFWGAPIFFVGGGISGLLFVWWWTARSPVTRRRLMMAMSAVALLTLVVFVGPPILGPYRLGLRSADDMHERKITIHGFTASPRSVAFVVPTRQGPRALVFVDRESGRARLIADENLTYRYPRFSWDGERLLFVRYAENDKEHELVSCFVKTWRCRLVLKTDHDVISPVEIDKDTIIYLSSPLITLRDRKRYAEHDFYLIKVGSDPIRLSDFGEVALYSINVSGDRILFGSIGSFKQQSILPRPANVIESRSEIFELELDRETPRILVPLEKLKPQYLIDGYSVLPSMSQDGGKVAFLNTAIAKRSYRFDLMVVDTATGESKRIDLEGKHFSRAAFAGRQMLYNELLEDRYRVRALDMPSGRIDDVFQIEFTKIYDLERVTLSFPAGR
jgi:hypothetical protein